MMKLFDREWKLQKFEQYNGIFTQQLPLAQPGKPFVSVQPAGVTLELITKVFPALFTPLNTFQSYANECHMKAGECGGRVQVG